MFVRVKEKIRHSLQSRGIGGTLRRLLRVVRWRVLELTPSRRRARLGKQAVDREFDERYGVDTAGIIQLNQLQIESANREYGVPYWASDPEEFRVALDGVGVRHEDYVFVDFGCGKGRALLLASELPFKKIVGVEFSPELVRIAERNLGSFRSDRRQCRHAEVLHQDAMLYQLPDEPLVLYFYNPFGREVMKQVVSNLVDSYYSHPREIYVVYANPVANDVWAEAAFLQKINSENNCAIYKADGSR